MKKRQPAGFTLIELIVVIAIIGLLASLSFPELQKGIDRARSVACMGNLRTIGAAVTTYVAENDGTFPYIELNEENPVYPPDEGFDAVPILERLTPYGLTQDALHCPSDKVNFAKYKSSYQWSPVIDGDPAVNAVVYGRRGARTVKLSRVRICLDYEAIHFGRCNRLYADGHAIAVIKDP